MEEIFQVKLRNCAFTEVRADADLALRPGDHCVFRREFFDDYGMVVRRLAASSRGTKTSELPPVVRAAAPDDLKIADTNRAKEAEALRVTAELVEKLKLEMKLINAHYSLDCKQVTIQFSADGWVDFRELVKELARALATRIELRQIGVRDESAIFGGISVCGQPLCCSRFLTEFSSINVKMAKEQDLSLTPTSISGVCCRLKCCLKYEHEGYLEMSRKMPRKGDWCDTEQGHGKVVDRNVLTGKVSVSFESGAVTVFDAADVKVCRGEHRAPAPEPPPTAAEKTAVKPGRAPKPPKTPRPAREQPASPSPKAAKTSHKAFAELPPMPLPPEKK